MLTRDNVIDECNGCMRCQFLCPKNAILFEENEEGFLYPSIDKDKCVKCNICIEKCALNNIDLYTPLKILAARNRDKTLLFKSSSGGVFPALAELIIRNKGVVYATSLNKNNETKLKRAINYKEIDTMIGSKYVQSYIENNYLEIKEYLKNGIRVLFVGTPCQVNGIKKYIGENDNLVLIDLICHGVPSPKIWRDFVHFLERKNNGTLNRINFRDKSNGWNNSFASAYINDRKISIQNYMMLYGQGSILRKSCYNCKFANKHRVSDITIGDFWGIDKIAPKWFDDKLGTSMILCNTSKGEKILESLNEYLDMEELAFDIPLQMNLEHPTPLPLNREIFWKEYDVYGIKYILKKYGGMGVFGKIKKKLGYIKRNRLKGIVNKHG